MTATLIGIDARLKPALAEEFEIEASAITADASIGGSLGIDSLDMVDLAVVVEQTLGVKLTREELTRAATYGDLVRLIGERLNG